MKTSQKRLALLLFAAVLWTIAGTSCNTIHGMGKDVERTGEGIQNVSR